MDEISTAQNSLSDDRGRAILRGHLKPSLEFELRTKTSVTLWISSLVLVWIQQFLPIGVLAPVGAFIFLSSLGITATVVSYVVYPRLIPHPRKFLAMEQVMLLVAWFSVLAFIYATGGAKSPYQALFFATMLYSAYFLRPKFAAIQIAIGSTVALAPLIYDWSDAVSTHLVPQQFAMLAVFWAMAIVVAKKKQTMVATELRARRLALCDPLTGVANLRTFELGLEDELARANAAGNTFGIVIADLNGLKEANTVIGHTGGDELIRRTAEILVGASRDTDQVARIGGDEFAVLLVGANQADVEDFERRCYEILSERMKAVGFQLSVSLGTAQYPADASSADDLINVADARMYAQKATLPTTLPARETSGGRTLSSEDDEATFIEDDPREGTIAAASSWMLAGTLLSVSLAFPGAIRQHVWQVAAISAFCLAMAAFQMIVGKRFPVAAQRVSDVAALAITVPALTATGGLNSPALPLVLLVVAHAAFYLPRRQANVRIALVLAFASWPLWQHKPDALYNHYTMIVAGALILASFLKGTRQALVESAQSARELAETDPLTQVANRRVFERSLQSVASANSGDLDGFDGHGGLVLVDLDNFKDVNTTSGHQGGDAVLRRVAVAMDEAVADAGTVCRIGGDEFAVIVPEGSDDAVRANAARCREAIHAVDWQSVNMPPVTVSVGYATWNVAGHGWDDLVKAADRALRQSKSAGKNTVSQGFRLSVDSA